MILALLLFAAALPVSIAASSLIFFPLLAIYLFGAKWTFPRWPPAFGSIEKAFLIFWGLSFLSALCGESLSGSRRALTKDLYFFVFVLVGALAVSPEDRWRLLKIFLYVSLASAFLGLLQFAIGMTQTDHHSREFYRVPDIMRSWPPVLLEYLSTLAERSAGTRSHPITFAEGLLLGLAVSLGAWRAFPERRLVWGGVSLVLIGGVIVSLSRGPWVAMAIVIAVAALLLRQREIWIVLGCGGLVIVALLWHSAPLRARVASLSDSTFESNSERLRMWKAGGEMTRDHPWLGVGPGHVRRVVSRYQSESDQAAGPWGHLHNTFIHMAAERGLPVLLAFLVWIGFFVRGCWLAWKNTDVHISGLGLAGLLGILVFLACGMTERVYGDTEIMMMFFFLLALAIPSSRFNTIAAR